MDETLFLDRISVEERFIYWIKERDSIRRRRADGESPPFTQDPIMQEYRFCNVVRMDDAVSRWLFDNWYQPNWDHPNMLLAIGLARFFNLPLTLKTIGFPNQWRIKTMSKRLNKLRDAGVTLFNSAYMVRGNDGINKIDSVLYYTLDPLKINPPTIHRDSMERTHAELVPRYGMGSFMAGQIVADLRHAVEGRWGDRDYWAPLGPGSKRGMNRLLGLPVNNPMSQDQFNRHMSGMMDEFGLKISYDLFHRMEAMDWQNCLCEFDKYERTRLGQGRPKRKFKG